MLHNSISDVSMNTSPRFATVCVRGEPLLDARENKSRMKLMEAVIRQIAARDGWSDLDALIFPGGFVRANKPIGSYDFQDRCSSLDGMGLQSPFVDAAKGLTRSKGVHVVFGVDGPAYTYGAGGDQLCIGATRKGITGIARKVFPTKYESDCLACFSADYGSSERIVPLSSGRSGALCACYDMFGVAERHKRGTRARNIRLIEDHDGLPRRKDTKGFREYLDDRLTEFAGAIDGKGCTVAIAAIHYFEGHSTRFWQCHGLAACSASLARGRSNPGYAIGAAHFTALPRQPNASVLAAARVPASHLRQAQRRKAHSWLPTDHFSEDQALVRLFS